MAYKQRVALIYGGRGLEHPVSVSGAEHIFPLIDRERYEVIPTCISYSGDFSIHSAISESGGEHVFPALNGGRGGFLTRDGDFIPIDCAFPLLHGNFGEDGTVQGLLASVGIPFVGCDARASAICLDKAITKTAAEALGIPTVGWSLVTDGRLPDCKPPVFIKPDCLGSSLGAGAAENHAELVRVFENASRLGGGRVLIEDLKSPIRELECAYFSAQGEDIFSSAGEILCRGFYSYERKYESDTRTVAKADISRDTDKKIRDHSERICSFIGVRHIARIDFFLADGELFLNEINTMPGMTESSLYLRLLSESGISHAEAINRLISDATGGIAR